MNSRIIIPVGLIAVGAGLYGFSQDYLKSQKVAVASEPTVQVEQPITMTMVWQAKSTIEARQGLTSTMFELVSVPEQQAIDKGIDPSEPINIEDTWIATKQINAEQWLSTNYYVTPEADSYIDYAISQNHVPFPMVVKGSAVIGGSVKAGAEVDIIAITEQNESEGAYRVSSVDIQPIMAAIKVLKVESNDGVFSTNDDVTVVLELSRKELATLTIAKQIAKLELHKSAGIEQAVLLQANSGDVLPQFKAIAEYRGNSLVVR
ncbi:Flp pilus assembly protein CpaB [Vibrio ulleungensis]|uniref:Flp pilus assembly protein CpaB n=1 Tax=Vibrio ulleungensis TaxID=2807619 RepID=A0ABS2HMT2_9VIBR|nr:Flp pilus assembly protein CpaB [Vibrio ulleungensis]MBM7038381.1 Flp pilus assembly protein CpaB [Vibrio ulleungensis]